MYTLQDHIHQYAVWTAARAVQRGFTTTAKIQIAIEASGLRVFAGKPVLKSEAQFNKLHRSWSKAMMESLQKQKVEKHKITYGRMAKIIAIYLKTAVILPLKGKGAVCRWIHPPIDAYLLKQIAIHHNLGILSLYRWTTLDEVHYWELCNLLKASVDHFDWRLEQFWSPVV